MNKKSILKSIFDAHFIRKVICIENADSVLFIICSMEESISLERWENLENLLNEYLKKKISLLSYEQIYTTFDNELLKKGVIIE